MRCIALILTLTAIWAAETVPTVPAGEPAAVVEAPPAVETPAAAPEAASGADPAVGVLSAEAAAKLRAAKHPLTLAERIALAVHDAHAAGRLHAGSVDYTAILPGMPLAVLAERLGVPYHIREDGPQAELRWHTGDRYAPAFIVWLRNDVAVRMRLKDRL